MTKDSKAQDDGGVINMLLKSAPAIMASLKIDPQELIPSQFATLFELAGLNGKSTEIASGFAKSLETGAPGWLQSFVTNISPLPKDTQKKATEIFDETLLKSVNQITNNLYKGIKEGEGLIFNAMLSDNTVSAMESILNFKKQIDKDFPGLSDTILSAASMTITGIVCAYAPAAGVILKTTGILEKATDFLKTENLEATVDKLKAGIAEIERDKELAKLQATGIKLSELSEQTHVPTNKLQKIGLNLETLKMIGSEIIKTPSAKEFIGKLGNYADEIFPSSKEDIEKTLGQVKQATLDSLKEHNVSPETIKKIEKELDNKFEKAAEMMETALDPKATFFDKVAAQQDAARMIIDSTKDIKGLLGQTPDKNDILKDVSSKIQDTVKEKMQGGKIVELEAEMKKLPLTSQKSVKEALGSNFTNQVAIQRGVEKLEKGSGVER